MIANIEPTVLNSGDISRSLRCRTLLGPSESEPLDARITRIFIFRFFIDDFSYFCEDWFTTSYLSDLSCADVRCLMCVPASCSVSLCTKISRLLLLKTMKPLSRCIFFPSDDINDNVPVFSSEPYTWFTSYGAAVGTILGSVTVSDADAGTFGDITLR